MLFENCISINLIDQKHSEVKVGAATAITMPLTAKYTGKCSPSPKVFHHRRSSSGYVSFSRHSVYVTDHILTSANIYTCLDVHCREHCPIDACFVTKWVCKICKLEREKTLCRLTDASYRDLEDKLKKKDADHKMAKSWVHGKDAYFSGSQRWAFKKVVDKLKQDIQELEEKIKKRRQLLVE